MSVKHFYIFRHGQTDMNVAGRYQGQTLDYGLNPQGRQQAEELAGYLADKGLDLVVCSALKRAEETAEIIGERLHIPVKQEKCFIEGNFGSVEGKTYDELNAEEKLIFQDWVSLNPQCLDVHFQNGESKRQILNRALCGFKQLLKLPQSVIGVATHSIILRVVLLHFGRFQHHIPHAKAFHIIYEDGVFRLAEDDNLLLLSCCAPCSCAVMRQLAEDKRKFSVVFYNPNIRPQAEYEKRRAENERVCRLYGVPFFDLEYDQERWCVLTKGLEHEPERGKRCSVCFKMRIKRVMEYALEHDFSAVASVLGVSRHKDLDQVNAMAELASRETRCAYQLIEGRKNGMQEKRMQLIKDLDLYNQTYCGCKVR